MALLFLSKIMLTTMFPWNFRKTIHTNYSYITLTDGIVDLDNSKKAPTIKYS